MISPVGNRCYSSLTRDLDREASSKRRSGSCSFFNTLLSTVQSKSVRNRPCIFGAEKHLMAGGSKNRLHANISDGVKDRKKIVTRETNLI